MRTRKQICFQNIDSENAKGTDKIRQGNVAHLSVALKQEQARCCHFWARSENNLEKQDLDVSD